MKKKWLFLPIGFAALIVLYTALAWRGDKIGLVLLAVTALMLTVVMGVYGHGWRSALEGWGRSTSGWAAAQTWGMKQDTILRDVLSELYEYDEEAVEIHHGRSANASLEYLKTFNDEDAAYITEGLRKEGT
jgi:hypothetical protein